MLKVRSSFASRLVSRLSDPHPLLLVFPPPLPSTSFLFPLPLRPTDFSLLSFLLSFLPSTLFSLPVAKHYLTSRESFNSTARYWAQAYAGAPTAAGGVGGATGFVAGGKKEKGDDAIALAGLDKAEVAKFENVSRVPIMLCKR